MCLMTPARSATEVQAEEVLAESWLSASDSMPPRERLDAELPEVT